MPSYEVEHVCPLTVAQQDEIAQAITRIHSTKFSTPKLFVNVRFTDITGHVVYVAGKRVCYSFHLSIIYSRARLCSQRDYNTALMGRAILQSLIHSFSFVLTCTWLHQMDVYRVEYCIQKSSNRIFAYVRHGPSRTQADYEDVSNQIIRAWNDIAPLPMIKRGQEAPHTELRMVMFFGMSDGQFRCPRIEYLALTSITGSITAVYEAGFMMPEAGQDKAWLRKNIDAFKKKAEDGDEDFRDMVEECKERGLI